MKPIAFAGLLIALAAGPALAQDKSEDFFSGAADLSLIQKDVDTISSKFLEYRDIPNGLALPFFRLDGQKDGFRYDLAGQFLQQSDQRYLLRLEEDNFRLDGDYKTIPHRFGNRAKTPEQWPGDGVFQIRRTLQPTDQPLSVPP